MTPFPTRRGFLKTLGALALGAVGGLGRASARTGTPPPNVLLIVADDLGQECLSSYGGSSYATPHLDVLARSGATFRSCFSTPLCAPSRLELMTGRYPVRNYVGWGGYDPDREPSFAQVLRQAGYATAVAGKWQLCRFYEPGMADHPERSGFDESCLWTWVYDDGSGPKTPSKYWAPWIWRNGELERHPDTVYGPDLYCDFLLDFMRRHADRPFLAYYPMALPHGPFTPTPESGLLARALGPLPQRARSHLSDFLFPDHVAYMDQLVGRLVAGLEEAGLRDRTLVLFTADNGTDLRVESRQDGRLVRGAKGKLTEPGTRVPLLASWPGTVEPGSVRDELVDLSDFLPTLADVAGAKLPQGVTLDGRSFLPLLRGRSAPAREWVYISHWEYPDARYRRAVRSPRWKLHGDGRLYDLASDPAERDAILAADDSAESARARRDLEAVIRQIEGDSAA